MSATLSHLRRDPTAGFGPCLPQNDYILSKDGPIPGVENETYWFSFDKPERALSGSVYFWVHTQLRTMSCFVVVWAGVKRYVWQAEHFNYHQFLPYPEVGEDYVQAPGIDVRIKILEPHERHEITYRLPSVYGDELELTTRAVSIKGARGYRETTITRVSGVKPRCRSALAKRCACSASSP